MDGYISYVSPSTIVAEGVYQFLRGSLYGAIWGLVTPFHAPGTAGAAAEVTSGVFRPAPPFSSITKSVPSNAIVFASILGVQRVACKSLEFLRRTSDVWNEVFGLAVTYRYYTYFLASSEARLLRHNRIVGGGVALAVLYANVLA